jgi:hypothetical protein
MTKIHLIVLIGAALMSVTMAAAIQPDRTLLGSGTVGSSFGQMPRQLLGQIGAAMSR